VRSPASAQLPQHSRRRQIPIAPLHCRCPTPRDFVPWRFSDAGCPSVGMVSACRHPKTCTFADPCAAAKRIPIRSARRRSRAMPTGWLGRALWRF
jgi:hypothetical protein